jgi:hypothetical protein
MRESASIVSQVFDKSFIIFSRGLDEICFIFLYIILAYLAGNGFNHALGISGWERNVVNILGKLWGLMWANPLLED